MKIKCIAIGKTKSQDFSSLIKSYLSKITHYINFEFIIINEIKSIKNKNIQKSKEAESILKNIKADSHIILLDENGKELSSLFFSKFIQHHLNSSKKEFCFKLITELFINITYRKAIRKEYMKWLSKDFRECVEKSSDLADFFFNYCLEEIQKDNRGIYAYSLLIHMAINLNHMY